jgi:hypothetical protein
VGLHEAEKDCLPPNGKSFNGIEKVKISKYGNTAETESKGEMEKKVSEK